MSLEIKDNKKRLIKIESRYYAYLKELTGKNSEYIMIEEGSTVSNIINYIIEKYGERMRSYILDSEGRIRSNITIAINAQKLNTELAMKHVLNDGDIVVILPPIAGG